jgi:hypothetical protein
MAKASNTDVILDAAEGKVTPVEKPAKQAKPKFDFTSLNTLAVVSLASAVTGFGAAAAVITGHISLAQIKKTQASGRTLAVVGIAAGYTVIGLWILSTLGFIALGIWGARYGVPVGGFDDHMREGQGFGFGRDNNGGGMFQMQPGQQGMIQLDPNATPEAQN